jgi:prepilin-type N-terminal cleavage/methylation domain-containing protein
MKSSRLGFTLVELSVVLVIIAVLAGVVVVGQSLIKSAHLRETIGDYDRYVKAIKEFQDKYLALPGDMSTATSVLGSGVSNGNGNGQIGTSTTEGVISGTGEWFGAWRHLSAAGMIEGSFSGIGTSASVGVNVPASKLPNASGWTLFYYLLTTDDTPFWRDHYGHVMALGAAGATITDAVALSATDTRSIDEKIDDGKPGTGFIRARRAALEPNCVTNDISQQDATYLSGETAACAPIFILGF